MEQWQRKWAIMYGMPSFDPKDYITMTTKELLTTLDRLRESYHEADELFRKDHSELVTRTSELNKNKLKERIEEVKRRLKFKGAISETNTLL